MHIVFCIGTDIYLQCVLSFFLSGCRYEYGNYMQMKSCIIKTDVVCSIYGSFNSKWVELENLITLRMKSTQCFIHALGFS